MKLLALLLAFLMIGFSVQAFEKKISWDEIQKEIANYQSDRWQKLYPNPHEVDYAIAELCSGGSVKVKVSKGTDGPHKNALINVYLNEMAYNALKNNVDYPPGSIVIKEKLNGRSIFNVDNIGGMVKREKGFSAENNDWEYFYGKPSGPYQRTNLEHCAACHNNAPSGRQVFSN